MTYEEAVEILESEEYYDLSVYLEALQAILSESELMDQQESLENEDDG